MSITGTSTATQSLSLAPPILLGVSPVGSSSGSLFSYSDLLTLSGFAAAGSLVTVGYGTTVLGTATADSSGFWSYSTPKALASGVYGFTATATLSGVTSAASAATTVTIKPGISSFTALTDQWSAPISIGGSPYYMENANTNGNAPWAVTQLNDHALRFNLKPGDLWPDNASSRSEISGGTNYAANSTVNISYQMTVQPGLADTGLDWQILGQMHSDDNSPVTQSLTAGYPVFAFHLTGANGLSGGDYLAIQGFYLPTGSLTPASISPSDVNNGYIYVSSQPIVRGQAYSIQVTASFQNNANGFLDVWVNGVQVVDYHGPIGYGTANYWKEGVYEGYTQTQPITIDYANTYVTSAPAAPIIASDVANGDRAMLSGTAQANSTVSIYDGSTLTGTAAVSGSGAWSYQTGSLAAGAHSFTAVAKDSAGASSAASLASSVTLATPTGPIVTSVGASAVTGEALVGRKITFTLTMSAATTVTGVPLLTLSNGATASYASGSGTSTLTFQYTVGSGDASTSGLSVTGVSLPTGASMSGSGGNAASLTGAVARFPSIVVDTTPVATPVFSSVVANANGSLTATGTAGANTTVHIVAQEFDGTSVLNVDGTAAVNASGSWTFTTPTIYNGWISLSAYDVNSVGDKSATVTDNGVDVSTSYLPSPIVLSNSLNGSAVTLSGVIPGNYGATAPVGATVLIFDGATQIGSTTTTTGGVWSFTTGALADGTHRFTLESKNAAGASAASLPLTISVGQPASSGSGSGSGAGTGTGSTPTSVSVAYYLANAASLGAAGSIVISDTAAAISSALDQLNADAKISTITVTDTPILNLNVAQTFGDTAALGKITNANYSITVTDTGANVSSSFDALNGNLKVGLILPTGGFQTLVLSLAQMTADTRALSLLDPFTITVKGTAASFNALTTTQIAAFAAATVTQLNATDVDVSLSLSQRAALGANGISVLQPYSGGTTEVVTYASDGYYSSILFQGITGKGYTSYTNYYGSNHRISSAVYSNGTTVNWNYNSDGTYSAVTNNAPGSATNWQEAIYASNAKIVATATSSSNATGVGKLTLNAAGLTVTSSAGVFSVKYGADTFALNRNNSETISAGGLSSETFVFGNGFKQETITGLKLGGSGTDVISFNHLMFSGMSASNTAAQDIALLLSQGAMVQSGSNVVIRDTLGDTLTLAGVTTSVLSQNAASVFRFT